MAIAMLNRFSRGKITAAALTLLAAPTLLAQALPGAGNVNRDATPSVPPRELRPVIKQIEPTKANSASTAVESVAIKVVGFKFAGNTEFTNEVLQEVVAGSVNKQLDFAGLENTVDKVSQFYRIKGFTVARAYLPPQQSADGVILINIVEGRVGNIEIQNTSKLSDDRIKLITATNLCSDQSANCKDALITDPRVERAVLIVKDLPGVTANVSLKPGVNIGSSDVVFDVKPYRERVASFGMDNFGVAATGKIRVNAGYDLNNFSGIGDQLSLAAAGSGGITLTGSVNYSRPFNYEGTRVGVGYSRGQYLLNGAGYKVLDAYGTSNTVSGYVSRPVQRSVNSSLYTRATLELKNMSDTISAIPSSVQKSAAVVRLGVNGDHVDGFGGYSVYGAAYSLGRLHTNDSADSANYQVAGGFAKIGANFVRQQSISGPYSFLTTVFGQKALNRNMDGSEQFGIGGPTAVRAYGGEGGGNTGAVATLELRYSQPVDWGKAATATYGLFYDRGWSQQYANLVGTNTQSTRTMGGYGFTFGVNSLDYYLRATIAGHAASQASTSEPGTTNKRWLQGGMYF